MTPVILTRSHRTALAAKAARVTVINSIAGRSQNAASGREITVDKETVG
jgi:hypothetical protein